VRYLSTGRCVRRFNTVQRRVRCVKHFTWLRAAGGPRSACARAAHVHTGPMSPWLVGRGQGGRLGHPLDNLGIRARLALRQHLLYQLDAALDLLGVIALTPPECSNLSPAAPEAHRFSYKPQAVAYAPLQSQPPRAF